MFTPTQTNIIKRYFDEIEGRAIIPTFDDMTEALRVLGVDISSNESTFNSLFDEALFECEECNWLCGRDDECEDESNVCTDCREVE